MIVFLLALCGLMQVMFLPGAIALKLTRMKFSQLQLVVFSFVLSLLFNYVLVGALVVFHIYLPVVMRSIFVLELIVFIAMYSSNFVNYKISKYSLNLNIINCTLILILACTIATYLWLWFSMLGQVFYGWDAIVSYNTWANMWANNHVAYFTWHYPQLLPINWSITYVIIGHFDGSYNYEFFARAIMPLFSFIMLLALLDLARLTRKRVYVLAAISVGALLIVTVNQFLMLGYTDVPVACLSLISIYILCLARELKLNGKPQQLKRYLLLGFLAVAAAAVMKQAGLYVALLYPFLAYFLVLKRNPGLSKAESYKFLAVMSLLLWVIVLPWYVYIQWEMFLGLRKSLLTFLFVTVHVDHDFKVLHTSFYGLFSHGVIFFLIFAIYGCFYNRFWRLVFILLAIPVFIIWMFFLNYSMRNLTLALPFIGVSAAFGIEKVMKFLVGDYKFIHSKNFVYHLGKRSVFIANNTIYLLFMVCIVLFLATILTCYQQNIDAKSLNAYSIHARSRVYTPSAKVLYKYYYQHGFDGKILTSWDVVRHFPRIGKYYQSYRVKGNPKASEIQSALMNNPKDFLPTLERYPAKYLFVRPWGVSTSKSMLNYLGKLEKAGKLVLLEQDKKIKLYKITRKLCPSCYQK